MLENFWVNALILSSSPLLYVISQKPSGLTKTKEEAAIHRASSYSGLTVVDD